ncbi:MAG: hypothetical protein ACE5FY_06140 [Nitrospiria bacterium]
MKRVILISTMAFGLFSCATFPSPERKPFNSSQINSSQIFNAPYDEVWAAVVDNVFEGKWPIASIQKGSGVIRSRFVKMKLKIPADPEHYALCPFSINPIGRRRGMISLFVRRISDSLTSVRVILEFQGSSGRLTPVTKKWVSCRSNGTFEKDVFKKLSRALSQG